MAMPMDRARDHQRRHGYSDTLAGAVRDFVDNLPPARATTVREIHRSADLLAEIAEPELGVWQHLVLEMTATERMTMSKKWARIAQGVADELGEQLVLTRLPGWWPPAGRQVSLERSGLPLMKHFLWLLDLAPGEVADELIAAVASLTWYPPREPLGILKPSIAHLPEYPSPRTAEALAILEHRLDAATSA